MNARLGTSAAAAGSAPAVVRPPLRFVSAASLFDGHDAAINMIRRLLQAPDHVDGGIVAVEERGRGDEAQWRPRYGGRTAGGRGTGAGTGVHGLICLFLYPRVGILY